MPIDTTTPMSPGWWLSRLLTQLGSNRDRYNMLDEYYRCENGIPLTAAKSVRQSYQRLMAISRTNFAELVVEAARERMKPIGFRTAAAGDDLGDKEAWRIWQANSLDADASLAFRSALTMSESFAIVGGVDKDIGAPLITIEDPRQVAVEWDPARRRRSVAAVKLFHDDVAGVDRVYLYLPGTVLTAERTAPIESGDIEVQPDTSIDPGGWEWTSAKKLPANVVPVVRFANRPDTFGRAQGEFEPHLPILDRINYTTLNQLEIATLQAFRQRAIKGVPTKDAQGNDVDYSDIFAADPGAMWQLPATADIWESGVVDLSPIRMMRRDDIQDLAAVTRTPLFYFTADAAQGSAEGASLAREGLVFRVTDHLQQFGESLEQVMALAFLFSGDTERSSRAGMEVIWADPQRFSLAERYDAATKASAAGVPWRTIMTEVLQFSPQQVEDMEAQRATDAFLAAAVNAPPVTPAVQTA